MATTAPKQEPLHVKFQDGLTSESYLGTSVVTGITALAGGGQSGATPLSAQFNIISTCATAADSCLLPLIPQDNSAIFVWVKNNGAQSSTIYPQVGDSINALSANAGLAVAAGAKQCFVNVSGSNWQAML